MGPARRQEARVTLPALFEAIHWPVPVPAATR